MNGIQLTPGDALLIVDVQNDFLPGGKPAVPRGDQVIPVLNRYIALFAARHLPVHATRDWHPAHHCSFAPQGGIWPPHCIVSKAATREKDAYSGFEQTDLASRLRSQRVERLFIGGLATDYCVLNTVRDALSQRFEGELLRDAIGAVDLHADGGRIAIHDMLQRGAHPAKLAELQQA